MQRESSESRPSRTLLAGKSVAAILLTVAPLVFWTVDWQTRSGRLEPWLWAIWTLMCWYLARYLWKSARGVPVSFFQAHYPAPEDWEIDQRLSYDWLPLLAAGLFLALTCWAPWIHPA
jgi:hypothetical protein